MTKKTSVNVPPPPRQRLMAVAPAPTMIPDNLSKPNDKLVDMNFKVHEDFHRRFKSTATLWGMSMKDLLEASYKAWVSTNGPMPPGSDDLFRRDV